MIWSLCKVSQPEGVYVKIGNPAFFLFLYFTGAPFWGELQHNGEVSQQKIKCRLIRTREIGGTIVRRMIWLPVLLLSGYIYLYVFFFIIFNDFFVVSLCFHWLMLEKIGKENKEYDNYNESNKTLYLTFMPQIWTNMGICYLMYVCCILDVYLGQI